MTIHIYECIFCGSWHEERFHGDCRQDDARFSSPEHAAYCLGDNHVIEVFPKDMDGDGGTYDHGTVAPEPN